jgi:hypothetical protein
VAQALELLVRDVVRDVVDRVERRVKALLVAELQAELARRRNGAEPLDPREDGSSAPEPEVVEATPSPSEPVETPAAVLTSTTVCRRCAEAKPLEAFPLDSSNADGHRSECRECKRQADRERRAQSRSTASDDDESH